MEINVSVQYNGGLLPDIMLLTSFSSDCTVVVVYLFLFFKMKLSPPEEKNI